MFLDLDAGVERFRGVVVQDGHGGLQNDRPGVDAGIDEVHGASRELGAVIERLRPAVEAGEGGEKGGVDVEDALGEGVEEAGLDDPHVAREDDGVHTVFAQDADDLVLGFAFKFGFEGGVVYPETFEVVARGAGENAGVRDVGDDDGDFGVERSRLDRVLEKAPMPDAKAMLRKLVDQGYLAVQTGEANES